MNWNLIARAETEGLQRLNNHGECPYFYEALRIYANQTARPLLIIFTFVSQFHVYLLWVNACLA